MSQEDEPGVAQSSDNVSVVQQQHQVKINPPLFKLKLLDALKNNDYEQLKQTVKTIETSANYAELQQIKNLILNLAVQVAPVKFIQTLLSEDSADDFSIDINHQDSDGNTPLHLVALNNRLDVAQLLLRDHRINDTVLNNDSKQPIELAVDLNMVTLMQRERARYVEIIANDFRKAFTTHDFALLDEILAKPRNFELLDINGYDPETGDTVLHEFIKKSDIGMVKWILAHGGDPFKRDKRGKLPIELVAKGDETMKQALREASQGQSVIEPTTKIGGIQAPSYRGYLRKWTNYASGYKLRWFILDSNGILSYYKSQDDTTNACRGSLNMKNAVLHLDSSEKLKFEIYSKSGDRWHLKGNHPVETNRWVWSLQGAIRFAKDREKAMLVAHEEAVSRRESLEVPKGHSRNVSGVSVSSNIFSRIEDHPEDNNREIMDHPADGQVSDADDDDDDESTESSDLFEESEPLTQEIFVLKKRLTIELKLLKELLVNLQSSRVVDESLEFSLKSVNSIVEGFDSYNNLISRKNEQLLKSLQKQRDVNELWINSIKEVENELIAKSAELEAFEAERKKIKKALNKRLTASAPLAPTSTSQDSTNDQTDITSNAKAVESVERTPDDEISRIFQNDEDTDDEFFDADEFGEDSDEENDDIQTLKSSGTGKKSFDDATTGNEFDDESEDLNEVQREKDRLLKLEGSFKGYEDPPRTELALKIDDRPKISLWGILKSMIGKDITKITLPVSFNEPTSMLQRIAEDLEYSYLLEQAASFEDSTLRMLYVAAFAASEYSSTLNRVAKPFNPLLGETYEYARPDLGFRFLTEQVSHHPPVTAVIAESPKWDYYGETPVKSGFNGRSFDVTPTATWFLHLRPDSDVSEEIYSWKKITSSVVGIMVGNPSIDNYGEMVITNNKTGDKCVLNFKPRGWTSRSICELSGVVYDKNGEKVWAIGGHWNSKIYGKRIIHNEVDIDDSIKKIDSAPNEAGVKFLMWQPVPRPAVPFNLTSYAITLNAPQPKLLEWVSSSDTRLRPDQRAMEEGRYDDASDLKSAVEEKQRASRKLMEEQRIEHRPNFFSREVHPITGEEYWKYNGRYWKMRNEKQLPPIDIFV